MKMKKCLGVLLALMMIVGIMPTVAFATESSTGPDTEQASLYTFVQFYDYFEFGEKPSAELVYGMVRRYLSTSGDEWYVKTDPETSGMYGYWELSYEKYMEIAGSLFTNPCEMKDYLAEYKFNYITNEMAYDPETGMVKIVDVGGVGGEFMFYALSAYETEREDGTYVYVQGLKCDAEPLDSTEGLLEGQDYYVASNGNTLKILSRSEVILLKTDAGYKIAGYHEIDYYITTEGYTTVNGKTAECEVLFTSDGYKCYPFSLTTNGVSGCSFSFGPNGCTTPDYRQWRWENDSVTINNVRLRDGYQLTSLLVEDKDGIRDVAEEYYDGYSFLPNGPVTLNLSAEKIDESDYYITTEEYTTTDGETVEYNVLVTSDGGRYYPVVVNAGAGASVIFDQGVTTFDGDDRLWQIPTASIGFSISVASGYRVTSVIAEDMYRKIELTEYSFGGYEVIPSGPLTLTVTTEKIAGESSDGSEIVIPGTNGAYLTTEENEYYDALSLVVDEVEAAEAEKAENIVISANPNVTDTVVYEIYLTDSEGTKYQPAEGDEVRITLAVPDGWDAADTMVYHVADDGTLTDMKAVASEDGKTVSFTTTHFSVFVLAHVSTQSDTGDTPGQADDDGGDDSNMAMWLSLTGISALGLLGAACLGRKRVRK